MYKMIKSNCFRNRNTGHRSCISIFLSVILILGFLLQLSPSANALHVSAAVEDADAVKDAQQGDKVLFKGDNFIVKFEILAKWNTAYNANVTIENTGKNTIHDWAIIFYSNDDITNLWNGKIAKKQNGLYLIDNATWNMDIRAGQSVSFGFTANYTDNIEMPPSYAMSSCRADVEEDDYTVDYILYSNSGNQINSAIHIKNNTKEVIEDWELEFDFDAEGAYKTKDGLNVQGYILNDKGEIMAGTKAVKNDVYQETTLKGGAMDLPTTNIKLWIDPNNGKYLGKYDDYEIKEDGTIYGKADGGKRKVPLYKVAQASFHNKNGLYEIKDNQYIETPESGRPVMGRAEVRSGLIELSNAGFKDNINSFQLAKVQMELANKLISSNKELLQEALRLVGSS